MPPQTTGNPLFESLSGFKMLPDRRFMAWYTNPYQDRDGEWFAEKAIDAEIDRQNKSQEYPELWFYHIPGARLGQVDMTFKAGRFAVALGTVDDNPIAKALAAYAVNQGYKLSHGFTYEPEQFKGGVYHQFKDFEISVLPGEAAANPYTPFTLLERLKGLAATMNEQQKKALQAALQSAGIDYNSLLAQAEKASAELDHTATFKAAADPGLVEVLADQIAPSPGDAEYSEEAEEEFDMKACLKNIEGMLKAMLPQAAPAAPNPAAPIPPAMKAAQVDMPASPNNFQVPQGFQQAFAQQMQAQQPQSGFQVPDGFKQAQSQPPAMPQLNAANANPPQNPALAPQLEARMKALEDMMQRRASSVQQSNVVDAVNDFTSQGGKAIQHDPNMIDTTTFMSHVLGGKK